MISDRLIVQERHFKIAKEITPSVNKKDIILIYGGSGTGKSEIADCLQGELFEKKLSSFVLSLDDFYNTMPSIRNINRKKLGLESVGTQEIEWDYLTRICEDFKEGKTIHFKRVHKYIDLIEHNSLDSAEIDVLILEGLYAGYMKNYGYGDYAVYLEGNPGQTLEFRQLRRKENPDDEFRQKVVQKEYNIVYQLKRYADKLIPFEE